MNKIDAYILWCGGKTNAILITLWLIGLVVILITTIAN
jgi:hypothetical protein